MHHDVGDRHVFEIENRMQHLPGIAGFLVGIGMERDGATQFLHAFLGAGLLDDLEAGEAQQAAADHLRNMGHWIAEAHQSKDQRRHGEGGAVSAVDGKRLGQQFAEDEDRCGGRESGIERADAAEMLDENIGHQNGDEAVDAGIAEEDGADDVGHAGTQRVDSDGALVALAFQLLHAGFGGRGQGCFRAGEEARSDDQGHQQQGIQQHRIHDFYLVRPGTAG
jgi:hypothetical protein